MERSMTVGKLKKLLKNIPDDLPLIYSVDEKEIHQRYIIYLPLKHYVEIGKERRWIEIATDEKNYREWLEDTDEDSIYKLYQHD